MISTETLGKLFDALAKAQSEFPVIPKTKTANIGQYSYKYADLSDILAAVKQPMSKNGLAITQGPTLFESNLVLATTIGHSSGEKVTYFYPIHQFDKAQSEGSEQTYKRRYALCAALGIQGEEDEDGAAASTAKPLDKIIKEQSKPKFEMPKNVQERVSKAPAQAPLFPKAQSSLGSFQAKFGKYKGVFLQDITIHDLNGYVQYLKDSAIKAQKPMNPQASEFVEAAEAFMRERLYSESNPTFNPNDGGPQDDVPMPDDQDEIPF
jgi:hypothetical protein